MPSVTDLQEFGFQTPKIWHEVVKTIAELEDVVWKDPLITDDLTRAEGVRHFTRQINAALINMELADPNYPELLNLLSPRMQWGLTAADCHYQWASVHGDNVYRISGDRGTARVFDIETRQGRLAYYPDWTLHDRLTKVEVGPGNHVDITLSRERPPGAVNWIQLPPGQGEIIFRQYYYDWDNEQPAKVFIVNENAKYPAPGMTTASVAEGLELFCDWLKHVPQHSQDMVKSYYSVPDNSIEFDNFRIGWQALRYGKGIYQCAQDEAIILEVKLPQAYYWSIQLYNHFWDGLDYNRRQSSLNGHQAYVDQEGIFRAVISHQDPGVANWLDAAGREKGLISLRYYEPDSVPIPTMKKVKLSEVGNILSGKTLAMTAEDRQKTLRNRAWSFARLRRE
ncbi:MAG: DUF1214 domain-containing protein [Porticoccaceae bacterium]|nr:DUF1214 domain-containing protein [Porticoccaceae bacterium]